MTSPYDLSDFLEEDEEKKEEEKVNTNPYDLSDFIETDTTTSVEPKSQSEALKSGREQFEEGETPEFVNKISTSTANIATNLMDNLLNFDYSNIDEVKGTFPGIVGNLTDNISETETTEEATTDLEDLSEDERRQKQVTDIRKGVTSEQQSTDNLENLYKRTAQSTIANLTGISKEEQSDFMNMDIPSTGDDFQDTVADATGGIIGGLAKIMMSSGLVNYGGIELGKLAPELAARVASLPGSAGLKFGSTLATKTGIEHLLQGQDRDAKDYMQNFLMGYVGGNLGKVVEQGIRHIPIRIPNKAYPFIEQGLAGAGAGAGMTGVQYGFEPEETTWADLGTNMAMLSLMRMIPLVDKSKRESIRTARKEIIEPTLKQKAAFNTLGLNRNASKEQIKQAYRNQAKQVHPDIKGGSQEQFVQLKNARNYALNSIDNTSLSAGIKQSLKNNLNSIWNSIKNTITSQKGTTNIVPVEPNQAGTTTDTQFTPMEFTSTQTDVTETQQGTISQGVTQQTPTESQQTQAPDIDTQTTLPDNLADVQNEISKLEGILDDAGDMADQPSYQVVNERLQQLRQRQQELKQQKMEQSEEQIMSPVETEGETEEVAAEQSTEIPEVTFNEGDILETSNYGIVEVIANQDPSEVTIRNEQGNNIRIGRKTLQQDIIDTQEVTEETTAETEQEVTEEPARLQEQTETPEQEVLNFRDLTKDDLTNVKGVSDAVADRILEYRKNTEPPFDLNGNVKGVGEVLEGRIFEYQTNPPEGRVTETTETEITEQEPPTEEIIETEATEVTDEGKSDIQDMVSELQQVESDLETARNTFEQGSGKEKFKAAMKIRKLENRQVELLSEIESIDPNFREKRYGMDFEELSAWGKQDITFNKVQKNLKTKDGLDYTQLSTLSVEEQNRRLSDRLNVDEYNEDVIANIFNRFKEMDITPKWAEMDEGKLGYYDQQEGEMGTHNVTDVTTLFHEIGHAVDRAMFGEINNDNDFIMRMEEYDVFEAMGIMLDKPINEIDPDLLMEHLTDLESKIRSELAAISKDYVRPMLTEEYFADNYRQSMEELLADFWVMYISNPSLANQVAPTVTKVYDRNIIDNPKVEGFVKSIREQIRAGGESPRIENLKMTSPEQARVLNPSPEAPVPKQADDIAARTNYYINWQRFESYLNVNEWTKKVSEEILEDVPFYIEGTGNPLKDKSYEEIKQEIESDEEIAQVVREIQYNFERVRQEWNETLREVDDDLRIKFLENYAPRNWETPEEKVVEYHKSYGTRPSASMQRIYPTLVEGIQAGLEPETTNILTLYQDYVQKNSRPIAMRTLRNTLFDMVDENGNPVALTTKELENLRKENPEYLDKEYEIVDNKLLQKKQMVIDSETGEEMLVRQNIHVRKDVHKYIKEHTQTRDIDIPGIKQVAQINNLIKSLNYLFSTFHAFDFVFESGIGGLHYTKQLKTLSGDKYHDSILPWEKGLDLATYKPFLRTAIYSGLQLDPMEDAFVGELRDVTDKIQEYASNVPGGKEIVGLFKGYQSKFQEILWHKLYTGSKINSFYGVLKTQNDVLGENPSDREIRAFYETAADQVNQMYGGQDWARHGWASPHTRQLLHLIIRAPDWTLSNLFMGARLFTTPLKNLKDYKDKGYIPQKDSPDIEDRVKYIHRKVTSRETRKYWIKMIVGIAMMINGLNYALNGWFAQDNPEGHRLDFDVTPLVKGTKNKLDELGIIDYDPAEDQRRYYASPLKQMKEVFGVIEEPFKYVGHKMAPIAQSILEQIHGTQAGSRFPLEFQDTSRMSAREEFVARLKRGVSHFQPFAFSGGNFALTLPMRRGISEYQAIIDYEDMIKTVIDPGFRQRYFGQQSPPENALQMAEKLDKELMLNGINPLEVNKAALRNLRSNYYEQLFNAVKEEDTQKAEEASAALLRLGVYSISGSADARNIPLEEEIRALKLFNQPSILQNSARLPEEILTPVLRFTDNEKDLEKLILDEEGFKLEEPLSESVINELMGIEEGRDNQ